MTLTLWYNFLYNIASSFPGCKWFRNSGNVTPVARCSALPKFFLWLSIWQIFHPPWWERFFIYLLHLLNFITSLPYLLFSYIFSAKVEQQMKQDRYFHSHYHYYVREMRILGYSQLLESYSYRSLTLQYMANAFGVSETFIDKEVIHYIHNFFHLLSSRRGIGYITNCKLYYSKSNVYFSASCHVLLLLEGLTAK